MEYRYNAQNKWALKLISTFNHKTKAQTRIETDVIRNSV